jgi:2TM domain
MTDLPANDLARIEHDIRARAKRRVRSRMGLAWHFVVFVIANVAMFEINQRYSPTVGWFVWPLAAWGTGLALHAFATLSSGGMTESMIQAEIARERVRRAAV